MSKAGKFSDALEKFSAPEIELILLLSGIMALFFTARPAIISDGLVRYEVVHALLHADPLPRIKYSLIQSILSFLLGFIAYIMRVDAKNFVAYYIYASSVLLVQSCLDRYAPYTAAGRSSGFLSCCSAHPCFRTICSIIMEKFSARYAYAPDSRSPYATLAGLLFCWVLASRTRSRF